MNEMKELESKSILILGIGNVLHRDDGVGVHVIEKINSSATDIPDNVEVIDGGTSGFDLLPLMAGRKKIIIIDALKVNDEPGSIYRFPASHIHDGGNIFSLHDMGVKKIIDMLRLTGEEPDIEIIGIVPEDIESLDMSLSDSVKKSIPKAVDYALNAAVL